MNLSFDDRTSTTMGYQIVVSSEDNELADEVRILIEQGWKPQGGVSVAGWNCSIEHERKGYTENSTEVLFAQAMVRTPKIPF